MRFPMYVLPRPKTFDDVAFTRDVVAPAYGADDYRVTPDGTKVEFLRQGAVVGSIRSDDCRYPLETDADGNLMVVVYYPDQLLR